MGSGGSDDDALRTDHGRPRSDGGGPCIRGLRIPVTTVVGLVAQGMTEEQIVTEYPDLETEDIREALRYAAAAVDERVLPLRPSA